MFEKPMISQEQKQNYQEAELEAIEQGNAWPTSEGIESSEIKEAFDRYLEDLPFDDLITLSNEMTEIYEEMSDNATKKEARIEFIKNKAELLEGSSRFAALVTFLSSFNVPLSLALTWGGSALATTLEHRLTNKDMSDLETIEAGKASLSNLQWAVHIEEKSPYRTSENKSAA